VNFKRIKALHKIFDLIARYHAKPFG